MTDSELQDEFGKAFVVLDCLLVKCNCPMTTRLAVINWYCGMYKGLTGKHLNASEYFRLEAEVACDELFTGNDR